MCIYTNNHHLLGSSPRKMGLLKFHTLCLILGFAAVSNHAQTPDCYMKPGHRGSYFLWDVFLNKGFCYRFPLCRLPGILVEGGGDTKCPALPCSALDKGICAINAPVPLPRDLEKC